MAWIHRDPWKQQAECLIQAATEGSVRKAFWQKGCISCGLKDWVWRAKKMTVILTEGGNTEGNKSVFERVHIWCVPWGWCGAGRSGKCGS